MKFLKYILLSALLLFGSVGYSQSALKVGNSALKVGNSLLFIPFNQYSMLFDGVDEYVNINAVRTALASTAAGTWSCWVKPVDATPVTSEFMIGFGDVNANEHLGFLMQGTTGIFRCICKIAGTVQWDLNTDVNPFSDGAWAHIAVVQDGAEPVIYVDGVAVGQTFDIELDKTKWFNDLAGLDNGRIGNRNFNNLGEVNYFNGNIDEVIFINSALTQPQIANIYNKGKPKDEKGIANGVTALRMGDKSTFDGTNFTFIDQIGNNNGTSVNMEFIDKTHETP